jgi:hypothetical protein
MAHLVNVKSGLGILHITFIFVAELLINVSAIHHPGIEVLFCVSFS